MAMKPTDVRDLKKSYKRILWFLLGVLVFDAFIAFVLYSYTTVSDVLCGFIIICITTILYLLFLWICAKIDKKREAKREAQGKKDPFSRK